DRSLGGLGLGLALVKSLVELHGGSVRADSRGEQQGSTFTITLPGARLAPAWPGVMPSWNDDLLPPPLAALPEAQPPLTPPVAGAPGSGLRVLVVDDNADILHMLAMFLQSAGHAVCTAGDAVEAIAIARDMAPQLCLLDIGLPGIS